MDAKGGILDITRDQSVLNYLMKGTLPEDMDMKERRRVGKRATGFLAMDGLLYKKASGKHEHRTVPPMEARLQIVEEFHQIGHAAPDRLRKLISRQYYWNNIGGDCVNVCTNCVGCQLISKEEIIPKAMRPIPVHGVLHRWHLDLIGPMKTTAAGNIYGVVAIDSTSKWVETGGCRTKQHHT